MTYCRQYYCRQYFFDAPIRVIQLPEIHHDKISSYIFEGFCHDAILPAICFILLVKCARVWQNAEVVRITLLYRQNFGRVYITGISPGFTGVHIMGKICKVGSRYCPHEILHRHPKVDIWGSWWGVPNPSSACRAQTDRHTDTHTDATKSITSSAIQWTVVIRKAVCTDVGTFQANRGLKRFANVALLGFKLLALSGVIDWLTQDADAENLYLWDFINLCVAQRKKSCAADAGGQCIYLISDFTNLCVAPLWRNSTGPEYCLGLVDFPKLTQVHQAEWMENHLGQLHLNTWVFPAFYQPIQLNIDRKLTEMMIYNGLSYFFWEWIWPNTYHIGP